jgi:hypothetical protein
VDEFLHQCANMAWGAKGIGGLPLSILCAFYKQKVLVVLERVQAISILKHVIIVGEGSSRLGIFLKVFSFLYLICFS